MYSPQSLATSDRTPTSNVTAAPTHNLSGRDTVRLPDETEVTTPDYSKHHLVYSSPLLICENSIVYYRIFAEDGAIPSRNPAPGDPFLGYIKARSVPPPHRDTARAVKLSIAKAENIEDRTGISLFPTPYSHSPMGNVDKVTRTGPGSTPREPLAFLARISDSKRLGSLSALESGGIAVGDTMPLEIRYRTSMQTSLTFFLILTSSLLGEVYYLLYVDGYEKPSKVAIHQEEPCLGRIRADFIAPPHNPAAIKRYISRVEKFPLAHADLYADISCNTPLKEDLISILGNDCPGLSPKKPMAIVQKAIVEDDAASIPADGRYIIKNRSADVYWKSQRTDSIYFVPSKIDSKDYKNDVHRDFQVNKHSSIIQVLRG